MSQYVRKTRDVWHLLINYGQGEEHECTEFSRKDALEQLRTYRANCPQYPARIVRKRERINA